MSHRVILADCLGPEGLATLADKSVDHVITDPPYDAHTHSRRTTTRSEGADLGKYRGHIASRTISEIPFAPLDDVRPVATQIARVTKRWVLVFCAVRQIEDWARAFESEGWRVPRVMCWVKPDASPQFSGDRPGHGFESIVLAHPVGRTRWNGGGRKGVYECLRIDRESGFLHPTQKPLALLEALVADFTDPGDLILDPFAGSATTLVAAKRLGRRAVGFERDPAFYDVASRRLAAAREQFSLLEPRGPEPKQASLLAPVASLDGGER